MVNGHSPAYRLETPSRFRRRIGSYGCSLALLFSLLFLCFGARHSEAAPLFVNEYNGVRGDRYLNGGDAAADDDGEQAADPYLGRIVGNGGNWFELVVTAETLDVRGWQIGIDDDDGTTLATLTFSQNPLLAALQRRDHHHDRRGRTRGRQLRSSGR
jgi:hypothetical protein